jgi:hypothetical protein
MEQRVRETPMTAPLSEEAAKALALVASEWFKTSRRLSRLVRDAAPGRIERERAQLAYSHNVVETLLAGSGLRMVTHDGTPYSPQLPAEPVNPEDFDTDEGLVVTETLEPTVLRAGCVVLRGRIILGKGI